MKRCLPSHQSLASLEESGQNRRRTKNRKREKKTSRICEQIVDSSRHLKVAQAFEMVESHSTQSFLASSHMESGDTYNTSVSSSSSRVPPSENGTTAPESVLVPTATSKGDDIVFSFRPHKSKRKRNGKNVKLTGPMKLSRRLS